MHNIFRLFVVLFNNFTFLICLQFVHFLVIFHNAIPSILQVIHKFLVLFAFLLRTGVFSPVFSVLCFLIVKALLLIFLFCEFFHAQCPLFSPSLHFCVILPSSSRQTPDKKKPCRIHRQGFFLNNQYRPLPDRTFPRKRRRAPSAPGGVWLCGGGLWCTPWPPEKADTGPQLRPR